MTAARTVLLTLGGACCLLACETNMPASIAGNADSPRKVLIAAEDSDFKRKVVAKAIEKLGSRDLYFRIIGMDQLAATDTAPFGAVLLVSTVRGGRLDERTVAFLQKDPTNRKTVLFYTYGLEGAAPPKVQPDVRVDSVSGASRDDRVDLRAGEIAGLLATRF
jgi:hypothetical protein